MHIPKAAWRRSGPLASLVARPVSGDRQTSSSGSAAALQGQVLWAGGPAQRPSEPVGSCRGGRSETQAPRREGEGGSSTEGKWEGTGGERSGRRKQCSPAGWTHTLADGQTNSSTLYPGAVGLSVSQDRCAPGGAVAVTHLRGTLRMAALLGAPPAMDSCRPMKGPKSAGVAGG